MSASPASSEPRTRLGGNPEPSRRLPPTERDFEIYEAVHIDGCSTRSQADKHQISQTRVRQVICRVVEWLGEVLPPQAKVAREQETHLARQIAADRFQRQYEQMTTLWDMTQESKYAGLRLRITTAQARLGVVGGRLDGLAADAIEGIPVPIWQPEPTPEPNPQSPSAKGGPNLKSSDASRKPRRTPLDQLPPDFPLDPISYTDITPEIVAARAAHGYPLSPGLIEYAKQHGRAWPRATAASSPPDEDCSTPANDSSPSAAPPAMPAGENPSLATACGNAPAHPSDASAAPCASSQPLLTPPTPRPITELRIAPDNPGALLSQAASACPDS